jgi:hypothetical protein
MSPARLISAVQRVGALEDVDLQLQALETAESLALQARRSDADASAQKAAHVRNQAALYETALEARIRLQPAMAAAQKLPLQPHLDALAEADPAVANALAETRGALSGLLQSLLQARAAVFARIPEVQRDAAAQAGFSSPDAVREYLAAKDVFSGAPEAGAGAGLAGRKRQRASAGAATVGSLDGVWEGMSRGWQAFSQTFRDAAVDTWARRLAFGGAAAAQSLKKAGKLKVLGADVSQQVREAMADAQLVATRAHPRRESLRVLGVAAAAAAAAGAGAAQLYEEAYDDGETYQTFLKEYLATASATAASGGGALAGGRAGVNTGSLMAEAATLGMTASELAGALKHRRVTREGVDRRSTKGRKMKFVVHPKLVAFVAPAPYVVPPDMAFDLDTIVASLFKAA